MRISDCSSDVCSSDLAAPRPQARPDTPRTDAPAHVEIQSRMTSPPKYPADAVAARTTGKVVVIVDVAADGSVYAARVEKSEPAGVFAHATLEAVNKWTFQTAPKHGNPLPGRLSVTGKRVLRERVVPDVLF